MTTLLPPSARTDRPATSHQGPLTRVTRACAQAAQRRPRTIIAAWLVLVVACLASGVVSGTRSLTDVQTEVGQSAQADRLLQQEGLRDPATENILVTAPSAALAGAAAADVEGQVRDLEYVAAVAGPDRSPRLSADGGRAGLVQVTLRGDPDDADDHATALLALDRRVEQAHPGVHLLEAGPGTEDQAINDLIATDLHHAELISLPITLLILVLAFGALVAASLPLVLGLTAVAAAIGVLGPLSHLVPNSDSTAPVVVLIGLAVGVDYSLFYLRREREERDRGLPTGRRDGRAVPESALVAAASSVGRAILVSAVTVVVALAGLMISGAGDLVSIGIGTIVVVAVAALGSLTVLPAMLALLGDRVDRGRVPGHRTLTAARPRRERRVGHRVGLWASLARAVTSHPRSSAVTALAVLGALAVPLLGMHTSGTDVTGLPQDLPVVKAINAIDARFPGAPGSAQLVVRGHALDAAGARADLTTLGARAERVTGGQGAPTVAVSDDGRVARVDVPVPDLGQDAAAHVVERLRGEVAPTATRIDGVDGSALVTGDDASDLDYSHRMTQATIEVIALVLLLGFLLLWVTFGAPLLAAAVMGLNLVSVGAAYGILTAVFQHTWAEGLLGFHSTGTVTNWLPLFLFVVLFGLSMDYSVLVLERIREARLRGASPREAAAEGVGATAGTVTSAAVVMVAVFSIFATLGVITLKEIGVGLAAAVLLDATLVRGVALPAVVTLLGERGWRVRGWKDAAVGSRP